MTALAIFLGGGMGSLLRYLTTRLGNNIGSSDFPYGTLISNIIACLLLGFFLVSLKNQIKESAFLSNMLIIGLCGGYSTLSTFSYETVNLLNSGQIGIAVLNVLLSITVCFGLIWFLLKS